MMNMMNIMLGMMVVMDRQKERGGGQLGTDKADNDEYDGGDSVDDDP